MPMMLVTVQYRPRPLVTLIVNQANITGMIHSIIWLVCVCWGLAIALVWVSESLVCSQVVINTSTGMVRSGRPRSSHKKPVGSGTAFWIKPQL